MGTRRDFLKISGMGLAGGALAQIGCGKHSDMPREKRILVPSLTNVSGPRSLRSVAEAHGILVGCAASPGNPYAQFTPRVQAAPRRKGPAPPSLEEQ